MGENDECRVTKNHNGWNYMEKRKTNRSIARILNVIFYKKMTLTDIYCKFI